ncbi:hypothetical protein BJ742DRAFT_745418 [Cladochytrium replicatum]|nr:hypothetical protein BJ742DRAFT_745418 [Cladochytrium replicatum]
MAVRVDRIMRVVCVRLGSSSALANQQAQKISNSDGRQKRGSERVNEVKNLEEREQKRIEGILKSGVAQGRNKGEERREAAFLEQEGRDQETKGILKAIKHMQEQGVAEKLAKVQSQKRLMLEVAKANLDSTERIRQQQLPEEEEDRKVLQYLPDREARETENDKLLASAQQDALGAQRAFEAYERVWRRKEKEQAERRAVQEKGLRAQRLEQQRARENAIAVEAHKMRKSFMKT